MGDGGWTRTCDRFCGRVASSRWVTDVADAIMTGRDILVGERPRVRHVRRGIGMICVGSHEFCSGSWTNLSSTGPGLNRS